jgi:hypothetical protein
MRKSRYDEAESGEFKLDACEVFFRYRVQKYVLMFTFVLKRVIVDKEEKLKVWKV